MKMPKLYLFDNDPEGEWLDDLSLVRHGLRNCPWKLVERFFPGRKGPGAPRHPRWKLWNLYVAGASLRKVGFSPTLALLRNVKLLRLIGYGPGDRLPSRRTYVRFVQQVEKLQDAVNAVLKFQGEAIQLRHEEYGRDCSMDTTAIRVHKATEEEQERARKRKEERELRNERRDREDRNRVSLAKGWTYKKRLKKMKKNSDAKEAPQRRLEATEGVKTDDEGKVKMSWWGEKGGVTYENWRGFILHTERQTASTSDHALVDGALVETRWVEARETLSMDAGLDSAENHLKVMEEDMYPVIAMRHAKNKQPPADPRTPMAETVYDRERVTHMVNTKDGQWYEAIFWGVDRKHWRLKYRCPCVHLRKWGKLTKDEACPFFGAKCKANRGKLGYAFWVKIKENPRYYCAIPRESERWQQIYNGRTTSERGFSYTNDECGVKAMGKELKRAESAAGVFLQAVLATQLMKLRKPAEEEAGEKKQKRRTG